MIGLAYFLIFLIVWLAISICIVWYLSGKKVKILQKSGFKALAILLIFLLPFSYDILKTCYMNITLGWYCSSNQGILKKVKDKPSSFLVRAGDIGKLFSQDVKFVEWRLGDKYSRAKHFSSNLPEGLYKAFLQPIGDPDCESFDIVFTDPDFLRRALLGIKNRPLDQCIAIAKVDRLMAKYQYGKISYVAKTPYAYSVNITDKYITNLFTDEKEGLSRDIGTSSWLPLVRFVWRVARDRNGPISYRCSKTIQAHDWQDLFDYKEGDE